MQLDVLGWGPSWAQKLMALEDSDLTPARVIREDRGRYLIVTESGECSARLAGRFRYHAVEPSDFPTTGDWVAIRGNGQAREFQIQSVLARQSVFLRKAVLAGDRTEEQVVAANIDTAFLVAGLDTEFKVRRLERYLAIAWDSGATPVIILNKKDLAADAGELLQATRKMAGPVPVLAISAQSGEGLEDLRQWIEPRKTYAFLGSSGVGKSTIINALLGEERLAVSAISQFSKKGRHTTTVRELLLLPGGAIVLDTPGMKVIGAWSDDGGLERTFADVEALAALCRFRDCRHGTEPGCAVRAAIAEGDLDAGRLRNYLRLNREAEGLAQKRKRLIAQQRRAQQYSRAKRNGWDSAGEREGPRG
jgi:ribosome biogenesis GTPase / thiamine phosphate phosphatase